MVKIWVDDIRPAPEGYIRVLIVPAAIGKIAEAHSYDEELLIDLDHDAGNFARDYDDYIEILNYLEERAYNNVFWREYLQNKVTFHLHSANPVGVENMRRIIRRNGWREI